MKAAAGDSPAGLMIFAGRFVLSSVRRAKIRKLFERVQKGEKTKLNASLIFVGDFKMKNLNKHFRKKDKTTDVLSFPLGQSGNTVDGEIYISFPQAKSQAPDFRNSLEGEILRLSAHGFLHLLGYDHHSPKEKKVMFAREEKYLKGLGAAASGGGRC